MPKTSSMLQWLLPVEWFTLAAFPVCTLLAILNDLRWFTPNLESFSFAFNHYIGPLFPILLFFIFTAFLSSYERRDYFKKQIFYVIRMSIVILVAIFIHFNLKLWAPIINSARYDLVVSLSLRDEPHHPMPGTNVGWHPRYPAMRRAPDTPGVPL